MNRSEIIAFFNSRAAEWDARMVRSDEKISCILDAAGVHAGCCVLDVACGTGVLFPDYLARGVSRVTGIDISPEMARIAASKLHDPRVEVICGAAESGRLPRRYDCCVIYNAWPHFEHPELLVRNLAAHLAPGGRLAVAHGMSLEALHRHHAGAARSVSRPMITTQEMTDLLSPYFSVDVTVSDEEKYIVAGEIRT